MREDDWGRLIDTRSQRRMRSVSHQEKVLRKKKSEVKRLTRWIEVSVFRSIKHHRQSKPT